jgi:hypothetical protein
MLITDSEIETAISDLIARAELAAAGQPPAPTAKLRETFERSARQALRRPDPIGRSMILRKLLRTVVPRSLRPLAKRMARSIFRGGNQR